VNRSVNPSGLSAGETSELLFSASSDGIFLVDLPTRRLVRANARLADITLHEESDLVGQPADCLVPDETGRREHRFGPDVYLQEGLHEDVALARADGFVAVVSLRVAHHEREGRPTAVCIARDETGVRMLERELITKHVALLTAHRDLAARNKQITELSERIAVVSRQAMLAEVVAEVAHSINNPLAAVVSSLRRLRRLEPAVAAEQQERFTHLVERAQQNTERMRSVVEDLRVTVRRCTESPQASELAAAVRTALAALEHRVQDVVIERELFDVWVVAPGDELHHAIVNLVDNALQAMDETGRIRIAMHDEGPTVALEIADDGPGIPDDVVDMIFDPFFTTKELGRGTGVGLSMVRRLASRCGGSTTAETRGALGGATVWLRLPRTPGGAR